MRLLALLALLSCGAPELAKPDPQPCLSDWTWCVLGEIDGGARVIGAP